MHATVRLKKDREHIRAKRCTVVLAYEEVMKRTDCTIHLLKLPPELAAEESDWLFEVTASHIDVRL